MEEQDDFTNRMCENCNKEFDISDSHYYDEEEGVCYCNEECYKNYKQGEDDVWFQVYYQDDFTPYCGNHEHLQAYKGFRYFECWGGGPEGGFITNDNNEVYEVNRTWGTPFTVKRVFDKMEMEARGHVIHLRLRP